MKSIIKTLLFIAIISCVLSACMPAPVKEVESVYRTIDEWSERYTLPSYKPNLPIDENEIENIKKNQELIVRCNNGNFVGSKDGDVLVWKGIPYAKAPKRFMQSELPDDNDDYYEAFYFGKSAIQPIDDGELASLYEQSEDCLYLNIWTSENKEARKNRDKKKPVLVYIHGGGWCFGGTMDPLYDGYNFAHYNPDILVCTISYRIGMYGQINLTSLEDDKNNLKCNTSMCNSVLDQITALKWISKNIGAFGGDPDNIIIAGESAGGSSVSILSTMPDARKYIKKVIAMSGGVNQAVSIDKTEKLISELREEFKVKKIEDAQNISETDLSKWWRKNGKKLLHHCVQDGVNIEKNPIDVWKRGDTKDLIIMQGHTANEFMYYLDAFMWNEDVYDVVCEEGVNAFKELIKSDDETNKIFSEYLDALKKYGYSDNQLSHEFMNDHSLAFINTYQATLHARNGGQGYSYTFEKSYDGSYKKLGAAHAVDCSYLFGNFDGDVATGTNDEVELSRKFQKMISNFCFNGNPSIDGYVWPEYNENTRYKMMIGDKLRVEENPEKERVEALVKIEDKSGVFLKGSTLATLFANGLKHKPRIILPFIMAQVNQDEKNEKLILLFDEYSEVYYKILAKMSNIMDSIKDELINDISKIEE